MFAYCNRYSSHDFNTMQRQELLVIHIAHQIFVSVGGAAASTVDAKPPLATSFNKAKTAST
jgi:hypothetical protein